MEISKCNNSLKTKLYKTQIITSPTTFKIMCKPFMTIIRLLLCKYNKISMSNKLTPHSHNNNKSIPKMETNWDPLLEETLMVMLISHRIKELLLNPELVHSKGRNSKLYS